MYILYNNDMFRMVSLTSVLKTQSSRSQLLRRKLALLKIIEHFQKNADGGVRFS